MRWPALVGRMRRVGAEVGRRVRLQQRAAHGADARGRAPRARRHHVRHARRAEDAPAVPAVYLRRAPLNAHVSEHTNFTLFLLLMQRICAAL